MTGPNVLAGKRPSGHAPAQAGGEADKHEPRGKAKDENRAMKEVWNDPEADSEKLDQRAVGQRAMPPMAQEASGSSALVDLLAKPRWRFRLARLTVAMAGAALTSSHPCAWTRCSPGAGANVGPWRRLFHGHVRPV